MAVSSVGSKAKGRTKIRKRERLIILLIKKSFKIIQLCYKLKIITVAYASIDWHDFVVVETVDYQQMELGSFPPPTNPDEVGARVLMQV